MKKVFTTFIIVLVFLATSLPALAKAGSLNPGEKKIKTSLLKIRKKQTVTKAKIKRNINEAKTTIKRVKQIRIKEKHKRIVSKNRLKKNKK